jgi:hypothetical protein
MRSMRLLGLLVCLLIILPLAGSPALAQTSGRTVTATARCVEWSKSAPAHVEVVLTNNSGLPISLSYLHGWTTSEALNPTFLMRDPGETVSQSIQDGDTLVVQAPWDDLRRHEGDIGMAIVVTSAGVQMPECSGNDATLVRPLGPKPTNGTEAVKENAKIAAETIGWLEAWRAYPALYALLHPDSQAEVSFSAVACWYADQYGIPTDWKDSVFTTDVLDVSIGPWTWGVTGQEYGNAAAISYTQDISTMSKSAPVTGTEHLVSDQGDGQFRWFFGLSKEEITAQPTNCDLGN